MNEQRSLIEEIQVFCRTAGIAESTFGRQAVNDGKFVNRLRDGKGVTAKTISRVRQFISDKTNTPIATGTLLSEISPTKDKTGNKRTMASTENGTGDTTGEISEEEKTAFRFYDNRQKYLMFVNTCSEKWKVAERVGQELAHVQPKPPALRLFDAGIGDGTVLTGVMRDMHQRFPNVPFYIAGKEISLEDVRLSLEKMPDRFYEHPATVLVITNMYYTEAPWLTPRSMKAASALNWIDVPLGGSTSHDFHEQITGLQDTLSEGWQVHSSEKTGNPLYDRPSVMVLYREDQRFLLDQIIPKPGQVRADYDLVIASQPYRARMSTEFKVQKVLAPLAKSLAPGGRLLGIHSCGGDPGLEIVQKIWPNEEPFVSNRHDIMKVIKAETARTHRDLNFNVSSDKRSVMRYDMHTLPSEVGPASIGTSTLLAAWNAATYVAQIEDDRLEEAMKDSAYLDATREVLNKHGELWFNDESFVISRRR